MQSRGLGNTTGADFQKQLEVAKHSGGVGSRKVWLGCDGAEDLRDYRAEGLCG